MKLDSYESWDHFNASDSAKLRDVFKPRPAEPPIVDRKLGYSVRRCKFEFRWSLRAAGFRMHWSKGYYERAGRRGRPILPFVLRNATTVHVGQVRQWDLVRDPHECARRTMRLLAWFQVRVHDMA